MRLKAGLSAATYNENITASSSNATDKTVVCSGRVYNPQITVDPGSLSGFAYNLGAGPSQEQTLRLVVLI